MSSLITGAQQQIVPAPKLEILSGCSGLNRVAMRFWERLFADVMACFPRAARAVFSGSCEGVMSPARLSPEFLDLNLAEASESQLGDMLRDAMMEAEFYGPPSPVLCSFYGAKERIAENLPLEADCADAGLLPFLAGWLLAACGVSLNALSGSEFACRLRMRMTWDEERRMIVLPLALSITEISEGLHSWKVTARLDAAGAGS